MYIKSKAALTLLLLACALPGHAGDTSLCTATCTADRQQCRKEADAVEKSERLEMVSSRKVQQNGPDYSAEMESQNARVTEAANRKFERSQACEEAYRSCTGQCAMR